MVYPNEGDGENKICEQARIQKSPVSEAQLPIVIVDDSADERFLLSHELKILFGDVPLKVFANGKELLSYLDSANISSQEKHIPLLPRLILMDLHMPKMSGIEVLKKMDGQEKYADIPVFMLSASQDGEEIDTAYQLGASAFLGKPLSRIELLTAIGQEYKSKSAFAEAWKK